MVRASPLELTTIRTSAQSMALANALSQAVSNVDRQPSGRHGKGIPTCCRSGDGCRAHASITTSKQGDNDLRPQGSEWPPLNRPSIAQSWRAPGRDGLIGGFCFEFWASRIVPCQAAVDRPAGSPRPPVAVTSYLPVLRSEKACRWGPLPPPCPLDNRTHARIEHSSPFFLSGRQTNA